MVNSTARSGSRKPHTDGHLTPRADGRWAKKVRWPRNGVAGRSSGSRYAEEFKRDSVRFVREAKYSFRAAATAVNVSELSLREWHAPMLQPSGWARAESSRRSMIGKPRKQVLRTPPARRNPWMERTSPRSSKIARDPVNENGVAQNPVEIRRIPRHVAGRVGATGFEPVTSTV